MTGIQFQPVDTWFFRDGTPFTADSASQTDVESLFPPHPTTVAGALRASLALINGWNGFGRWPREICNVLGDGPEDLGVISMDGPFLLINEQPLFRAPRHLLGSIDTNGWNPCGFLRPGSLVTCDLGEVQLPEISRNSSNLTDPRVSDQKWFTQTGMNAVLQGKLPDCKEIKSEEDLWSREPHVGIERDRNSRSTKEGMLYSTRHIRPQRNISLGAGISGLPDDWDLPFSRLVSFGGEGRLAECLEWNADVKFDVPLQKIEDGNQVAVIVLSPLDIEEEIYCGKKPLADLGNALVVSACLARPQRIGGWDSLVRRPLPIRCVLPPGSVLFCEITDPHRFQNTVTTSNGITRIGTRKEWGFGLVTLGIWPD